MKFRIEDSILFILFSLFLIYFSLTPLATAQVVKNEPALTGNENLKWHIEGGILVGAGIEKHEVGRTTDNDEISISGGGGVGGKLIFGYRLSPKLDLNLGIIIQNSSLKPNVKNADGKFFRTALIANMKYRIQIFSSSLINLGGGFGYYFPGDLDIDVSEISGGAHNIYGYDNSLGFHLLAEYEGFFRKDISWSIGLQYSTVSYDIKSAKSNGITIPLDQLPASVRDEVGELDGGGVDLLLGVNYYF
jgi:hypothetical protein